MVGNTTNEELVTAVGVEEFVALSLPSAKGSSDRCDRALAYLSNDLGQLGRQGAAGEGRASNGKREFHCTERREKLENECREKTIGKSAADHEDRWGCSTVPERGQAKAQQ